jgi:hypothetical protein
MDGSQFDAWTRRRFGIAGGFLAASLLGAGDLTVGKAKKKGRKRCKRLAQGCKPGGNKKRCCQGLRCDVAADATARRCCRETQAPCASDSECCQDHRCDEIFTGSGNRCCVNSSAPCQVDDDCCGLFICLNGFCD